MTFTSLNNNPSWFVGKRFRDVRISWMSTGSAAAQSFAANVIIFHLSPFSHMVIRARDIRKSNNIFRNLDFNTPKVTLSPIITQFIFKNFQIDLINFTKVLKLRRSLMCKWTMPSFIFCNSRPKTQNKGVQRSEPKNEHTWSHVSLMLSLFGAFSP